MRLIVHTTIEKPYDEVFAGFTFDLFKRLIPSYPPAIVQRFDGCSTGDEAHIELTLPVLQRTELWISRIVRAGEVRGNAAYPDEFFFVDEGVQLPFFLTFWRHTHRIITAGTDNSTTVIVDDIEYHTLWWLAPIVVPMISSQFHARQALYKEYFNA